MEEKRNLPLMRVFLALLIATLLFFGGMLIGYSLSFFKYQQVVNTQDSVKYDILSLDVESQLLYSCNSLALDSVSKSLDSIGDNLNLLEEKYGKRDQRVLQEKKNYFILEAKHFTIINNYNQRCNQNISTILFFYSNSEDYKNGAEKIGFILGSLKNNYKEKVMIYSFDFDMDLSVTNLLKSIYNVTNRNTIVVNGIKINSISNIDDVEIYIH